MITITRTAPDRLDIVARGTLDERAVESAADELDRYLVEGAALLIDLRELGDVTARGLARDVVEGVRLARCRRIALVAEERWLRAASRVDGAVLPGVEVRAFEPHRMEAARDWLEGEPDASPATDPDEAARPAIRLVESARPTLLEVVDGHLDDDDIDRMLPAFERALAGDDPIDVLARVESLSGFEPGLLVERDLWRLKRRGLARLRRYTIVTSIGWLGGVVDLVDKAVSAELRAFEPGEEALARAWLDEGVSSSV